MLERDLAKQLGLKREILSKIRDRELIENRHYVRTDTGILLKGDGLDVMLQALGHEVRNAVLSTKKNAAAALLDENAAAAVPEPAAAAEASSLGPQTEVRPHLPKKFERLDEAELVVDRCFIRNPNLVMGKVAGRVSLQRVRVRSNKNFRAGMKMPCVFLEGNLWRLTRRLPRSPGRW